MSFDTDRPFLSFSSYCATLVRHRPEKLRRSIPVPQIMHHSGNAIPQETMGHLHKTLMTVIGDSGWGLVGTA